MAEHNVQSPSPVAGLAGYPGRPLPQQQQGPAKEVPQAGAEPVAEGDQVLVHAASAIVLQLLRERILARTRVALGLPSSLVVPEFAERVADESLPDFVGRLLSAQNQLAARRLPPFDLARSRRLLAEALQQGAHETTELLAGAEHGAEGQALVRAVLVEFGRRLAV